MKISKQRHKNPENSEQGGQSVTTNFLKVLSPMHTSSKVLWPEAPIVLMTSTRMIERIGIGMEWQLTIMLASKE